MSTSTSPTYDLPPLLTAQEVAQAARLPKNVDPCNAMYRLRKSGRLTGVRIGKSYKYRREDVVRLLSGASA